MYVPIRGNDFCKEREERIAHWGDNEASTDLFDLVDVLSATLLKLADKVSASTKQSTCDGLN